MRAPIRRRVGFGIVLASTGMTLFATIHVLRQNAIRPDDRGLWHRYSGTPLLVEARGKGRAWRFSYCGPDGILGSNDDPTSDDHLKLPTGTDVVIQLRSDDYIYVFSCPDLKLKEIAVPDLEFSIAFRAEHGGEYDLAMDAMCGFRLPPGETMGSLSVVSERAFRLWLEGRPRLN